MKILFISDNLNLNEFIKTTFKQNVIHYNSPYKGMGNIEEIDPDIIIWDENSFPSLYRLFSGFCSFLLNKIIPMVLIISKENDLTLESRRDLKKMKENNFLNIKRFFLEEKINIEGYIKTFDNQYISFIKQLEHMRENFIEYEKEFLNQNIKANYLNIIELNEKLNNNIYNKGEYFNDEIMQILLYIKELNLMIYSEILSISEDVIILSLKDDIKKEIENENYIIYDCFINVFENKYQAKAMILNDGVYFYCYLLNISLKKEIFNFLFKKNDELGLNDK